MWERGVVFWMMTTPPASHKQHVFKGGKNMKALPFAAASLALRAEQVELKSYCMSSRGVSAYIGASASVLTPVPLIVQRT
jgi:hypothetical protein